MINNLLAPTAAGDTKEMPSFEAFVSEMNRRLREEEGKKRGPLMESFSEQENRELLEDLYKAAQEKITFERQRQIGSEAAVDYHRWRLSMARANNLIGNALSNLEEARKQNGEELTVIEDSVRGEDFEFTFDEVIQHLKNAMEAAETWQLAWAAQIDPSKRDDTEKEMVATGRLGEVMTHDLPPLREKSKKIDLWFIGEVAARLDRHQDATKKRIRRYDKIIWVLFDFAFGDKTHKRNSIRRELGRQKKSGRPLLRRASEELESGGPASSEELLSDNNANDASADLGEKLDQAPSSQRKISGKNRTN